MEEVYCGIMEPLSEEELQVAVDQLSVKLSAVDALGKSSDEKKMKIEKEGDHTPKTSVKTDAGLVGDSPARQPVKEQMENLSIAQAWAKFSKVVTGSQVSEEVGLFGNFLGAMGFQPDEVAPGDNVDSCRIIVWDEPSDEHYDLTVEEWRSRLCLLSRGEEADVPRTVTQTGADQSKCGHPDLLTATICGNLLATTTNGRAIGGHTCRYHRASSICTLVDTGDLRDAPLRAGVCFSRECGVKVPKNQPGSRGCDVCKRTYHDTCVQELDIEGEVLLGDKPLTLCSVCFVYRRVGVALLWDGHTHPVVITELLAEDCGEDEMIREELPVVTPAHARPKAKTTQRQKLEDKVQGVNAKADHRALNETDSLKPTAASKLKVALSAMDEDPAQEVAARLATNQIRPFRTVRPNPFPLGGLEQSTSEAYSMQAFQETMKVMQEAH